MSEFITILLIGISISMDAFSLALVYGTLNLDRRKKLILSLIVGIFHFFMPFLGILIGNLFIESIILNHNYIVTFIFILIGLEMIVESYKKERKISPIISNIGIFLFGLAVSIDSFAVGVSINVITDDYIVACTIFSILSFCFTYTGLYLGSIARSKLGRYANILGGILLTIIGIMHLFD